MKPQDLAADVFALHLRRECLGGVWLRVQDWPVFWANVVTLLPAAAVLERKVRASLRSAGDRQRQGKDR